MYGSTVIRLLSWVIALSIVIIIALGVMIYVLIKTYLSIKKAAAIYESQPHLVWREKI